MGHLDFVRTIRCQQFLCYQNFVDGLEEECFIVVAGKEAWSDPDLEAQLEGCLPLQESLSLLKQFRESVAGTAAEWKIYALIDKNTGVQLLSEQPCTFCNVPLVTCDVERLFSRMKQAQKFKPNATMETIHNFLFMAS